MADGGSLIAEDGSTKDADKHFRAVNRRTFAPSRCMMPMPLGWGADDRVGFFDGTWCRNFGEVDGVGLAGGDCAVNYAVIDFSIEFAMRQAVGFALQFCIRVAVEIGFEPSHGTRKENRRESIRQTASPRVR